MIDEHGCRRKGKCPECDHDWDDHRRAIGTACLFNIEGNIPCGCTENPWVNFLPDYEQGPLPIICGSQDAEKRRYRRVDNGKTIYLIADQPNAADNIYKSSPGPSEGFGGRTLSFPLVDGTVIEVQGPWHIGADAFLLNRFPELAVQHYTFGVIGLERESTWPKTIIRKVIYKDDDWVLGPFQRVQSIAQEKANELGCTVYCYSQSQGGSSCGPVNPKKEN